MKKRQQTKNMTVMKPFLDVSSVKRAPSRTTVWIADRRNKIGSRSKVSTIYLTSFGRSLVLQAAFQVWGPSQGICKAEVSGLTQPTLQFAYPNIKKKKKKLLQIVTEWVLPGLQIFHLYLFTSLIQLPVALPGRL